MQRHQGLGPMGAVRVHGDIGGRMILQRWQRWDTL
jgi:hypothetical protein